MACAIMQWVSNLDYDDLVFHVIALMRSIVEKMSYNYRNITN